MHAIDPQDLKINKIVSILKFTANTARIVRYSPLHTHILAYQFTGSYLHQFKDKSFPADADTLLFLHKDELYEAIRSETGYAIAIHFTTVNEIEMESFAFRCTGKERPKLKLLFFNILNEWLKHDDKGYFHCLSCFYKICALIQPDARETVDEQHQKIYDSVDYIRQHYTEETLSVEALAKQCGLSTRRYRALFKRIYKQSPISWISAYRIEEACNLLRTGDYQISEVALMTGFADVYYFSRKFKEAVGLPPSHWQRQLQHHNL